MRRGIIRCNSLTNLGSSSGDLASRRAGANGLSNEVTNLLLGAARVLLNLRAQLGDRDPEVPAGLHQVVVDPEGLVQHHAHELEVGGAGQLKLLHELVVQVEGVKTTHTVMAGLGLGVLQHELSRGQLELTSEDLCQPAALEPSLGEAGAGGLEEHRESNVAVLGVEGVVEQRGVRELEVLLVDGESDLTMVASAVNNLQDKAEESQMRCLNSNAHNTSIH